MSLILANGITHHVQRLAAKGHPGDEPPPTVVLVHGLLTDSLASYYFTLGPLLASAGFEVIMYDLRGHGRSTRPGSGYRLADFLADLDTLLDALGTHAPVHLVGNSFGGTIAFGYAERRPERIVSIAVIESTPATPAWAAQMAATLARYREQFPRSEVLAWISDHHGAHAARLCQSAGRLLQSSSIADEVPAGEVLSDARVSAMAVPIMAIYGGDAELVGQAEWLASLLPSCTSVVVPGQGHWVLVNHAALVGELILEWLRRHSGLTAPVDGEPSPSIAESLVAEPLVERHPG